MKIAIYARVSSETQAKEGTIDSQIEALREYAKTHNLEIAFECIDDGYSGTELARPGLDQLRDIARDGQIEAVLILSPDRLSRKQINQILLLEEFKKQNIQVLFTNQTFSDSPEDQLMLTVQGAVAEFERAKILARMRRGTKHSVLKGQVLGNNAPYGYRFVRKTNTQPARWEVDPEETEIVRMIFDLYVNKRMKGTEIAKHLEQESILNRSGIKRWWSSQIYSILQTDTYTGTAYMFKSLSVEPKKHPKLQKYRRRKNSGRVYRPREDWIGIPVTPIIDNEIWQRAQDLRKQNTRQSRRNNKKNEYLLRGLVICGLCASAASGYVSNKNTYYSCGAKRNKNVTTKPHDENIAMQRSLLDKKVWSGLVELLNNPDNLKEQLQKRMEAKKTYIRPLDSGQDKIEKELGKLELQEKRIIDAYREGVIGLAELKDQKAKIADRRNVLQAKKKTALSHVQDLGQPEITMTMLGDVSARFSRVMAKADFATREKLVNRLINSVSLFPQKVVVEGNIPVIQGDVLSQSNLRRGNFNSYLSISCVTSISLIASAIASYQGIFSAIGSINFSISFAYNSRSNSCIATS